MLNFTFRLTTAKLDPLRYGNFPSICSVFERRQRLCGCAFVWVCVNVNKPFASHIMLVITTQKRAKISNLQSTRMEERKKREREPLFKLLTL